MRTTPFSLSFMISFTVLISLSLAQCPEPMTSGMIGCYDFEDWTGNAETTPNYPFSTSHWDDHISSTEVTTTCEGVAPVSGNYYFHQQHYSAFGPGDDPCLNPSDAVNSVNPHTLINLNDLGGSMNEIFIFFYFQTNSEFGDTSGWNRNKWIELIGNTAIDGWAHFSSNGQIHMIEETSMDWGAGVPWPTGNPHGDGDWHTFAMYVNIPTGEQSVWLDTTDWEHPTETRIYDFGTTTSFAYVVIDENFSSDHPSSSCWAKFDDIQVWDRIPDSSPTCTNGTTRSCSTGQPGICSTGTETCTSGTWGPCVRDNPPTTEICGDGIDQDCSGGDLVCPICPQGQITSRCDCGGITYTSGYCCSGSWESSACPMCVDFDNDTYGENCVPGPDCNDSDPSIHANITCPFDGSSCGIHSLCMESCPSPPAESCTNFLDDDCDGSTDCSDNDCSGDPSCQSPSGLCQDLVLLLHFDEDSATLADSSGNGNDGTVYGATFTPSGLFSGAYSFDGLSENNDYINAGSDTSLDNIFSGGGTISAWIYQTGTTTTLNYIYNKDDGAGDFVDIFWTGNSILNLNFKKDFTSGGDGEWSTAADSISLNQWHHVAVVYDSSSYSSDPLLYIDGVSQTVEEVDSPGASSAQSNAAGDFEIGGRHAGDRAFPGIIDDFAAWNRTLSSQEISDLYDSGSPVSCSVNYHRADIDESCDIDSQEITDFIYNWYQDSTNYHIHEVMTGITAFKAGGYC